MAKAGITEYKEDQIILKQGDPDKSLYKILSGQVAVYINYEKDDEYLVGIQAYPSCFGEMTILSGQPSFYTVVALTDTKILCVPEENFESFTTSTVCGRFDMLTRPHYPCLPLVDIPSCQSLEGWEVNPLRVTSESQQPELA